MTVPHSDRLNFRLMTEDDLEDMTALFADPSVMEFYPSPKNREETKAWIDWNERNYSEHGYGLWIIETKTGEFVGDCGLTWQAVNGRRELEVGYHVRVEMQRRGYATEAATACRDFARDALKAVHLVAIIHPENIASKRVAQKIGLEFQEDDRGGTIHIRSVYGARL